jgi:hypothetical protein
MHLTGRWRAQSFDIWSHLVPLPPLPAPPIHVLVKGAPRSNAAAKDSEWVRCVPPVSAHPPTTACCTRRPSAWLLQSRSPPSPPLRLSVSARKVLEDSMPADVNEIVLCDQGGELLEGMSSNFFAVTNDGTLVTADEGVLVCAPNQLCLRTRIARYATHPAAGVFVAAGDCARGAAAGVRDGRDSRATAAAHVG